MVESTVCVTLQDTNTTQTTMTTDFEEQHGIVQSVASTKANRTATPLNQSYTAKQVFNRHYHQVDTSLDSRQAINNMHHAINDLYLHRQYTECLSLCYAFIKQSKKICHEVQETASRCCVKLKQYAKALEYMQFALHRNELGYVIYLATLHRLNKKFDDALKYARMYVDVRGEDAYGWSELGNVLIEMDKDWHVHAWLGYRCFAYAKHLMCRHMPISSLSNRKRIDGLDRLLNEAGVKLGAESIVDYEHVLLHDVQLHEPICTLVDWINRVTAVKSGGYVEEKEECGIKE